MVTQIKSLVYWFSLFLSVLELRYQKTFLQKSQLSLSNTSLFETRDQFSCVILICCFVVCGWFCLFLSLLVSSILNIQHPFTFLALFLLKWDLKSCSPRHELKLFMTVISLFASLLLFVWNNCSTCWCSTSNGEIIKAIFFLEWSRFTHCKFKYYNSAKAFFRLVFVAFFHFALPFKIFQIFVEIRT